MSEVKFAKFVDTVLTKYFPNGFTISEAYGKWKNPEVKILNQSTGMALDRPRKSRAIF